MKALLNLALTLLALYLLIHIAPIIIMFVYMMWN